MAFKLKHKNVHATGEKASPFKINETLVMGAGIASKGFTDIAGAYNSGTSGQSGVEEPSSVNTNIAEVNSEKKTCVEQGLEGQALIDCQNKEAELNQEKQNKNEENNNEENDVNQPMSRADFKANNLKGEGEGQFKNYNAYKASFE
tara:strand:- start:194 stop:631 length:438 start_codon:yes stop_codon:yes gene_type:complete